MVFSTFLCRAFTAQYLYTPRWSPHSSITLHGAPVGLCTLLVNHHGILEPSDLVLEACFLLKAPFRGMLLTLRGGPKSLAPRAHRALHKKCSLTMLFVCKIELFDLKKLSK